jgi:hypothetical protein
LDGEDAASFHGLWTVRALKLDLKAYAAETAQEFADAMNRASETENLLAVLRR